MCAISLLNFHSFSVSSCIFSAVSLQPAIVIVELGGNDGLRGLSVSHQAELRSAAPALVAALTFAEWLVSCFGSRHPPNLMRNLHLSGSGDR